MAGWMRIGSRPTGFRPLLLGCGQRNARSVREELDIADFQLGPGGLHFA